MGCLLRLRIGYSLRRRFYRRRNAVVTGMIGSAPKAEVCCGPVVIVNCALAFAAGSTAAIKIVAKAFIRPPPYFEVDNDPPELAQTSKPGLTPPAT
jgi:hypothetical protein